MSHTVKIKTEFSNFEALKTAFNKLNWQIKADGIPRTYPSDPQKGKMWKHIAVNPDNSNVGYDVGIEQAENGNIQLFWDPYGGSIGRSLGNDVEKLKSEYILAVAEQEYEEVMLMETLADGTRIFECDDGT